MISKTFIERPRLAVVVSLVIILAGALSMLMIPVAQFPQITPPEIRVSATYPGANAEEVAQAVGAPIEAQVNGVESMLYMSSTCGNDGSYSLAVTFAVGTDPDIAQVNVLNRAKQAESRLPAEVVAQGVTVRRRSSDMLGIINFYSPDSSLSRLFLSNYVSINVKDAMARVDGVSEAFIFGELKYSMRIWMDPERLTSLGLTASDVTGALESQNVQAAAGSLGKSPDLADQKLQYTLRAKGRLTTVKDFEDIVVRTNDKGGVLYLKDVARVSLGAETYSGSSLLDGKPAVGMAIYSTSGANALATMQAVEEELTRLEKRFPKGMAFLNTYDSTKFVESVIEEIVFTLLITFVLVVGVTYLFLQDWRATLIPTLTIPVSLIGTFAALLALGYSANTITLFALVLAIGLVVDDAIVVVENVQRILEEEDVSSSQAAIKAMGQVTGPIVATTLVLLAVFLPVAFLPGITGQLYRQFAVTLCFAVILSAVNSLTLSPALCAILLRRTHPVRRGPLAWFSRTLTAARNGYVATAGWLVRRLAISAGLVALVLAGSYFLYATRPTSFLPQEDQGLIFLNYQLPETASLPRTTQVTDQAYALLKDVPGIASIMNITGHSILSGDGENVGLGVVTLKAWNERKEDQEQIDPIMAEIRRRLDTIPEANIIAFVPPAIRGLGMVGGFDLRLQALNNQSPQEMSAAAMSLIMAANQDPDISRCYTTYSANAPQIFVDLDRVKAQTLGVPVSRVFQTLQSQLGSQYVNDFNLYDRVYQVKIQADAPFRRDVEDIDRLYVKSDGGDMVPLSTLVKFSTVMGPQTVERYNQFASVTINGGSAPGKSSGEAMAAIARLAREKLPQGYAFEWSGLSYQESKSSGQVLGLFGLALLFGYLFLVAQYESWTIPVPVILSISVAAMGALAGLAVAGMPMSIYAQIGLVLLVGLAAKNAILIVEFSKTRREEGVGVVEAALEGARIRFRAVLMTAFAFILGVVPLVVATGAGAASRRHIGTTVFAGMLAATLVGIFLIPPLYVMFQRLREGMKNLWGREKAPDAPAAGEEG